MKAANFCYQIVGLLWQDFFFFQKELQMWQAELEICERPHFHRLEPWQFLKIGLL